VLHLVHGATVLRLVINLSLCIIPHKSSHSSPFLDIGFKGIAKVLVGGHGINISNVSLLSNENSCGIRLAKGSWGIGKDRVSSNSLVSFVNIVEWKTRLEMLAYRKSKEILGGIEQ